MVNTAKIFEIESQAIETTMESSLLRLIIKLAKEAGYTHIQDNWGHNAHDTYEIDKFIEQFNIK